MKVIVVKVSWGRNLDVKDIQGLLENVFDVFSNHVKPDLKESVYVYPKASLTNPKDAPITIFRSSSDEPHKVYLNVNDKQWDKFSYQFSHELCHIFSNYDNIKKAGLRAIEWVKMGV